MTIWYLRLPPMPAKQRAGEFTVRVGLPFAAGNDIGSPWRRFLRRERARAWEEGTAVIATVREPERPAGAVYTGVIIVDGPGVYRVAPLHDGGIPLGLWRKHAHNAAAHSGWADETTVMSVAIVPRPFWDGGDRRLVTIQTAGCPPTEIWDWELFAVFAPAAVK